jgi:hypothetical protein
LRSLHALVHVTSMWLSLSLNFSNTDLMRLNISDLVIMKLDVSVGLVLLNLSVWLYQHG